MNAIELISQDLFDKVRSRFSNLEMGNEDGNVTSDPRQARFFDFDFVLEGNKLGRVSISINERGSLKVFYGQGILEGTDPVAQEMWFNFLREMRNFAKRRLLRFDTRDITKSNLDKDDFQYLASTGSKEDNMANNMAEGRMFGSSKSSYLPLEKTRLIVRHNSAVDETQRGARTRNINAIYVENADGERWKCPINSLRLGEAMQRHVANGGRPYDECGNAIVKMAEQIAQLAAFKRQAHHVVKDSMHGDANQILERACAKLDHLRECMTRLSTQRGYESWKEAFAPAGEEVMLDQATMEDYKSKFTVSSFAEDLTQYFPLIHSIMRETGELDLEEIVDESGHGAECLKCGQDPCECNKKKVDEFSNFEAWANALAEGKLEPDTVAALKDLLAGELSLGVDGTDAIQSLQGIGIHDDELESALEQLAKVNSEASPTDTILAWVEKQDPEAAKELGAEPAAPKAPADATAPAPEEVPAAEGEGDEFGAELQQETSLLDIAEMVKSFYDKETKKFPLGTTGVVTKVRKEYGEKAGDLAERLCNHLTGEESGDSEEQVDELRQTPEMEDLNMKIKHLNDLYIRARRLQDQVMIEKIKQRLAQLSAKKMQLRQQEEPNEGYEVVPSIDKERYTDLSDQGLEGPFRLKSGKVVYYDKKEGKYYDRDTDMYLSHDDYAALNKESMSESIDDQTFNDIMKLAGLKK